MLLLPTLMELAFNNEDALTELNFVDVINFYLPICLFFSLSKLQIKIFQKMSYAHNLDYHNISFLYLEAVWSAYPAWEYPEFHADKQNELEKREFHNKDIIPVALLIQFLILFDYLLNDNQNT